MFCVVSSCVFNGLFVVFCGVQWLQWFLSGFVRFSGGERGHPMVVLKA